MQPAVRIENLSKMYHIGALRQRGYRTLRESLMDSVTGPWRRWRELSRSIDHVAPSADLARRSNGQAHAGNGAGSHHGEALHSGHENGHGHGPSDAPDNAIWALKDVSFDVQHGEVVGIIGRNGAGKSTLLKILSRITEPTSGRVVMNGRVASLLEVGTGFHPELTGRENIYLNGAMLGMHRHEIKRKFDAIVDFSGIETFLDTPVKRYSSGMYVRLAFAVAAHLDPEILIIDEVLAVGDAEFQKKCLGKMQDVARSGRTVLFVSHNLPALMNLCSRSVLLEAGAMKDSGPTELIIQRYLQTVMSVSRRSLSEWHHRQGNQEVVFTCFDIRDELGNSIDVIQSGQPVVFVFGFRCCDAALGKKINVGIGVHSSNGERLTVLYSEHTGDVLEPVTRTGEFHLRVDRFPFNPGRYFMFARIEVDGNEADFPLDGVGSFDVVAGNYYGTGRQTVDRSWAPFLLDGQWLISRPMGERELIP